MGAQEVLAAQVTRIETGLRKLAEYIRSLTVQIDKTADEGMTGPQVEAHERNLEALATHIEGIPVTSTTPITVPTPTPLPGPNVS